MRYVPSIIIAVALLLAPAIWVGLSHLLSRGDFQGAAVDSSARIEIEMLRQQIEDLQARVEELRIELARLPVARGGGYRTDPDAEDEALRGTGPNEILHAYAQVVLIADRLNVNRGLVVATPDYLEAKLGRPSENLGDDCAEVTNETFASNLVRQQVGPVEVTMMRPAAESLARVFETVRKVDPDLYARINTSGSLCVRNIRGTSNRISTHSFGLALDLNIDGHLDNFTDGKTQLGLTILADFFHAEGWVWGAGFQREDSMHFEISRRQLDDWIANGEL
ncbi:MAG: M15 family metallopeptidase [Rhodobacteraceae bacterium]|nr:M15 family metallopeptidase [Paracoccaceae bacterium]